KIMAALGGAGWWGGGGGWFLLVIFCHFSYLSLKCILQSFLVLTLFEAAEAAEAVQVIYL
ncbi:hypothetical protein, partial [Escherichia coli]|uniref:hypothetical protein n=1 Tax=Escherichia coli TaxID=562 RepID=UPI001CD5797F